MAVYCKKDPELRNLPDSHGDLLGPAPIQATPPEWCPLASRVTAQFCPNPCA
jgi:hypothetical protein